MLVALFWKAWIRLRELPVITFRVRGNRYARWGRDQVMGTFIDNGPADVHVIQVHVRDGVEAHVDDLIVNREPALSKPGLDPPAQLHRLAVNRRLANHPLRP